MIDIAEKYFTQIWNFLMSISHRFKLYLKKFTKRNHLYFSFLLRPVKVRKQILYRCVIKSPKQRLETYCFCSVSYYYYYCSCSCYSPFFPCTMNLSTADLRNYWTEFVVKGVKVIF